MGPMIVIRSRVGTIPKHYFVTDLRVRIFAYGGRRVTNTVLATMNDVYSEGGSLNDLRKVADGTFELVNEVEIKEEIEEIEGDTA